MSVVRIVALMTLLLIKICVGFNIHNNACENYNDYFVKIWSSKCYYNPNILASTPEIIHKSGYPFESHTVTTQDGYILTIFRIPPRTNRSKKKPVFLVQGILTNNEVWVDLGNRSLAFYLSDKGYDVWLGNIRGCKFARTHIHYEISSSDYWNFNLDTLAYFDIGEQLKFIANKTKKQKSIIYVGHSMGTTLAFLYSAGYPKEAGKLLSGIIALAPVLYFEDVKIIQRFAKIAGPFEQEVGVDGLFHEDSINEKLVRICSYTPHVCRKMIEIFVGSLSDQFRPDDLLLLFSHSPTGLSVQVLKHYLQWIKSGRLKKYDHGKLDNVSYNLGYIKTPVYLLYGKNDALVSEKSVHHLFDQLGSQKKQLISIPKNGNVSFNHLDFLMGRDIRKLLHFEIIKILRELN